MGPNKEAAVVWLLSLSIVLQDVVMNPAVIGYWVTLGNLPPRNKSPLGKARAQHDCFSSAGQDLSVDGVFQDTLYIYF